MEPKCRYCNLYDKLRCRTKSEAARCKRREEPMEKEEHVYRLRIEVKSVPNLATALAEVASNPEHKYPIEIVSDEPLTKEMVLSQAYDGVMREVLGAVMANLVIELITEEDDAGTVSS